MDIEPLYLMLPVTFAASFAFMFPVASPPNAMVFAHGYVSVADMVSMSTLFESLFTLPGKIHFEKDLATLLVYNTIFNMQNLCMTVQRGADSISFSELVILTYYI